MFADFCAFVHELNYFLQNGDPHIAFFLCNIMLAPIIHRLDNGI